MIVLENLIIFSTAKWYSFLFQLINNPLKLIGIFDFDGTITEYSKSSHWKIMDYLLNNSKKQKELVKIGQVLYKLEEQNKLDQLHEFFWVAIPIINFYAGNISRQMIANNECKYQIRKFTKEIINLFKNKIIISFGIYDVISQILKENNLENCFSGIFATKLTFNINEIISGFDSPSIVLPHNKGKIMLNYINGYNYFSVVFGDSLHDKELFKNNFDGLNVFVFHQYSRFKSVDDIKKQMPQVDIIICGESFEPFYWEVINFLK